MTTITSTTTVPQTGNPAANLARSLNRLNRRTVHHRTHVFIPAKVREEVEVSDGDRAFIRALTNGGVRHHVAMNR